MAGVLVMTVHGGVVCMCVWLLAVQRRGVPEPSHVLQLRLWRPPPARLPARASLTRTRTTHLPCCPHVHALGCRVTLHCWPHPPCARTRGPASQPRDAGKVRENRRLQDEADGNRGPTGRYHAQGRRGQPSRFKPGGLSARLQEALDIPDSTTVPHTHHTYTPTRAARTHSHPRTSTLTHSRTAAQPNRGCERVTRWSCLDLPCTYGAGGSAAVPSQDVSLRVPTRLPW